MTSTKQLMAGKKNKSKVQLAGQSKQTKAKPRAPKQVTTVSTAYSDGFPKSKLMVSSNPRDNGIIVSGTEYVGAVATGATPTLGTVLRNDYVSPLSPMFSGGRLPMFGRMYEKYRFTKLVFRYHTTVPSTSQGAILMAFDKDYADESPSSPNGDEVLRTYMAWENVNSNNTWVPFSLKVNLKDPQSFYYTNDTGYDGRLVYQGQLYVAAAAALTANTRYGFITVDYEMHLFDPQMDNTPQYTAARNPTPTTTYLSSGWQTLLGGDAANRNIGLGKVVTDPSSGALALLVNAGNYCLEQNAARTSGNGGLFAIPYLVDKVSGLANSSIGTRYVMPSNALGTTGGGVSRMDYFTVPSGGSYIYPRWEANAPVSFDNYWIRLTALASSLGAI